MYVRDFFYSYLTLVYPPIQEKISFQRLECLYRQGKEFQSLKCLPRQGFVVLTLHHYIEKMHELSKIALKKIWLKIKYSIVQCSTLHFTNSITAVYHWLLPLANSSLFCEPSFYYRSSVVRSTGCTLNNVFSLNVMIFPISASFGAALVC